jgi:hypothetical protein
MNSGQHMTTNTSRPHPVPKRHHYLPESYLKRFAFLDGGKQFIVIHHREDGFLKPQSPKNTASIAKQYVLLDPDGSENFSLEETYSQIESDVVAAMVSLELGKDLPPRERKAISKFVGTTLTRTPEGIDAIQAVAEQISSSHGIAAFTNPDHVYALLRVLTQGLIQEEARCLAAIASKLALDPNPKPRGPFKPAVLVAYVFGINFAEQLENRSFLVQRVPEGEMPFITTDAPVVLRPGTQPLIDGRGIDPWSDKSLILMPLSLNLTLTIHGLGVGTIFKEVSKDQVHQMNLLIAGNRWKYVFGNDEAVIRNIIESSEVASRPHGARMTLVTHKQSASPDVGDTFTQAE